MLSAVGGDGDEIFYLASSRRPTNCFPIFTNIHLPTLYKGLKVLRLTLSSIICLSVPPSRLGTVSCTHTRILHACCSVCDSFFLFFRNCGQSAVALMFSLRGDSISPPSSPHFTTFISGQLRTRELQTASFRNITSDSPFSRNSLLTCNIMVGLLTDLVI